MLESFKCESFNLSFNFFREIMILSFYHFERVEGLFFECFRLFAITFAYRITIPEYKCYNWSAEAFKKFFLFQWILDNISSLNKALSWQLADLQIELI